MASKNEGGPAKPVPPAPGAPDGVPLRWVKVSHHSADHIATRYPYAAYGSNLALSQMARRCPGAQLLGGGLLRSARLVFARYLGIVADEKSDVPVGVYTVTAADVAALDRYEGLGKRSYERYLVTVEVAGVATRCFTYVKVDNRPCDCTETYWATCNEGYRDWQFDQRRLRRAREHARANAPQGKAWGSMLGYANGDGEPRYIPESQHVRTPRARPPVAPGTVSLVTGRPLRGRLDERASVADFKAQVESLRAIAASPDSPTPVASGRNQNVYTGRDGRTWRKVKGTWIADKGAE